ncbi:permease prefix domain 1-containing protein [Bacillus massiliigorillae]|uniref:permease prefix domain 1-containing protein n=1 Tax=Bacillus massiliigorillae TaxID=1243664 RepID=UPI0003A2D5DD|nr:permease prefix domain 1-containing protein [Bacillus massiliigorillae]
MNEKIQRYVNQLFVEYPDSQQLNELKEEIIANSQARIQESIYNGMSEEEAIHKAMKELGDVSEVAEQISTNKKYEVIDQMFNHKPIEKKYALGYALATGVILFGIITALIVYFQSGNLFISVSTLFPFAVGAVPAFVFLSLIRETAEQFAMKPVRAWLYTGASVLLTFGVFVGAIVYLERIGLNGKFESMQQLLEYHNGPLFEAIASILPFVIPAICLLVFLVLTEKERNKPSVWTNMYSADDKESVKHMMVHGNLSGALWIFAFGIFLMVGLVFNAWAYSWIVFIFAVGIQVLLEAFYVNRRVS